MAEQTICIFGGTGFVGTRLATALTRAGYNLRVPTRHSNRGRHLRVLPSLELIETDVHDESRLPALLEGCDAAINLVGILNERGRSGEGFRRAHPELTDKIVTACRRAGVGRLLQMSALKANAERGPSHYLRTKGEAENILRAQDPATLGWTIFQPAPIFGPRDGFLNRFDQLLRWSPILPLPRPESRTAPVYVEDVTRAMITCLQEPATAGATYQMCGPQSYSLAEVVRRIARARGRRRLVVGLPDPLGRLQGRIMDFVPGKPFSTDNFLSLTVNNVCTDSGLERLGVKPRSLEALLTRCLS